MQFTDYCNNLLIVVSPIHVCSITHHNYYSVIIIIEPEQRVGGGGGGITIPCFIIINLIINYAPSFLAWGEIRFSIPFIHLQ